jgi:hypothetical protein
MRAILNLLGTFAGNPFKSRRRLEIENLFLRHQLHIALRRAPRRLRLRGCDRALLVSMTRRWPSLLGFLDFHAVGGDKWATVHGWLYYTGRVKD